MLIWIKETCKFITYFAEIITIIRRFYHKPLCRPYRLNFECVVKYETVVISEDNAHG